MSNVVKEIDTVHNTLTINREKYKEHCFKSFRQRMNDLKLYIDGPYNLI